MGGVVHAGFVCCNDLIIPLQTGLLRGEVPVLPSGEADVGRAQTLQRTGD